MSNEVIIALVSASSALFGSIVGVLGTVITQKIKNNFENKQQMRKEKLDLYSSFIGILQKYINSQNELNFLAFTDIVNKIKIKASNSVSKLVSEYYFDVCTCQEQIDGNKHSEYQRNIINAMRRDLGLKSSLDEKTCLFALNFSSTENGKNGKHSK